MTANGTAPVVIRAEELLAFGLRNYRAEVSILDFSSLVEVAVPGNARKRRPARVTLRMPDGLVRKMVGKGGEGVMFLCHVPVEVVERFLSPVVKPGEER